MSSGTGGGGGGLSDRAGAEPGLEPAAFRTASRRSAHYAAEALAGITDWPERPEDIAIFQRTCSQ